jgi:hypothetical protein
MYGTKDQMEANIKSKQRILNQAAQVANALQQLRVIACKETYNEDFYDHGDSNMKYHERLQNITADLDYFLGKVVSDIDELVQCSDSQDKEDGDEIEEDCEECDGED